MQGRTDWLQYAIPIVVVAIVLGLRIRALGRPRRLRLETLWIVPALYLCVAAAMAWSAPPSALGWLAAAGGLAAGAALGWQRGRLMAISIDPETHMLSQRGSPAAILFLFALIAIRMGLRAAAAQAPGGWHLDAAVLTETLVGFALGLFSATRLEMYLRARRLLLGARAGRRELGA